MSDETREKLEAALADHVLDEGLIDPDEIVSGWFITGVSVNVGDSGCNHSHYWGIGKENQPIDRTFGLLEIAKDFLREGRGPDG